MGRRIRYSELETRTARDRLKPGKKVYWRALDPGRLSLGYRRRRKAVPGEWLKRTYVGTDARGIGHYKQAIIGVADDFADADGVNVLSFGDAQERARGTAKPSGPLTVRQAMAHYTEYLRSNGRPNDAQWRIDAHILPELGDELVDELTSERIRKWLADYANSPALVRTKAGKVRQTKTASLDDPEVIRRRRSSANRVLTILKAALNHAYDEGRVSSNDAWGRRVKPFEGVDKARVRYLTIDEARRLVNACAPDFRSLARGALETGCRYGELIALQVADFNPNSATVTIRKSKSGKARHVILSEDGSEFFKALTAGRAGDELIFRRADGGAWKASQQGRPMAEAVARAKIKPTISFHGLRHSWASHAVMNGVPLMIVAKNLGHTDTGMVEKHYGHLAPSYIVDAIRAGAPKFGFKPERTNVRTLSRSRRK